MKSILATVLAIGVLMSTAQAQFFGPPMGQSAVTNPYGGTYYGSGAPVTPRRGTGGSYRQSQAKSYASACEATCRSKCQVSWRVGGYRNVEACYAAWAKINAMGMGERCEAASRARGGRPGPC
jgi:hypothetical protein